MFKSFFEYKALTVKRYFVALFTAYFDRDGFSQDFWNESGRAEKLFTTPWIDLSPQNSFQSPECAVHRIGIFTGSYKKSVANLNAKFFSLRSLSALRQC